MIAMGVWIDILYIAAAIAGILSLFWAIYSTEKGKRLAGFGFAVFFTLSVVFLVLYRDKLSSIIHENGSTNSQAAQRSDHGDIAQRDDSKLPGLSKLPEIMLPPPQSFRPSDVIKRQIQTGTSTVVDRTLGAYKCRSEAAMIVCYLVVTRIGQGNSEYRAVSDYVKLIDNFNREHVVIRVYFIDGKGIPQETVNLAAGDMVWAAYEFGGASKGITSAHIAYNDGSQLFLLVE